MKLYQSTFSPFAARCRIVIYAKGISEVEFAEPPGGKSTEEYKRINPTGKVPALDLDGKVLVESEVICEYFEDRYPSPALLPESALDRAQVRLLARVIDLYVGPSLNSMYKQMKSTERNEADTKELLAQQRNSLASLQTFLGRGGYTGGDYAVGGTLTLADCAMVPVLFLLDKLLPAWGLGDALNHWPALAQYWRNIQTDKFCAKVISEMTSVWKIRMEG